MSTRGREVTVDRPADGPPTLGFGADRPQAGWTWRIGVLVFVGILGLPTMGLLGTVHLVRRAAESRARDSNAVAAAAVAAAVGESFAQRLRVLDGVPLRPVLSFALSTHNRGMLLADAEGASDDGQYCRFTVRSPGVAPVTVSRGRRCWSPTAPSTTARGVQVVGPSIVGNQAFTGLDLAVPGYPGASLQAVFSVKSLTAFRIPGTGTNTTVVAGPTIVSSTTPAIVGQVITTPASRTMIRSGRPATGTVYSSLLHARVILAYRPVVGTGLGVFFSMSTKVAYAPADHLARILFVGYLVLLCVVVALAGLVVVLLRRRDRAAEAAALMAEARQRTTVETVAEGIAVFELHDGRPVPVLMNPAAEMIWGGSLDDVREMWSTWRGPELVSTVGTPVVLDDLPVAVVARAGEASTAVYGMRRNPTDELRWLRSSANPIRDGDGTMIGIVSSFLDVTSERDERARVVADRARFQALAVEARDSERALRESEERFRAAFEHAPIGKALIGLDGHYQQVNKAMCELTGYSEEQLRARTDVDITYSDDVAADAAAMHRLLAGDSVPYVREKRYLTATGRIVWASTSSSIVRSDDGTPLHFIAQIQDITERREHEETLADERRRLREAQTIGHVGSWEMDIVTGVLSCSDTFLELHGVDPTDFMARPAAIHEWIHPDDTDRMVAGFFSCLETGEPMHARYRVIRHDDKAERWFDTYVARRQDGQHLRLSGTTVDVTELAVAAEQVAAARDLALEASKQKSAFLATMSHEIRTPMNAVIGMTGLLLDTPLDADQLEFVETVRSSGDTLLSIINDILDYSKIEVGGLTLECRPFELRDCVEDALDLVAATPDAAGLELVGRVDEACPAQVVGDVTRFRQVLVNLLSNAVKFTAHGEVVLRIKIDGERPGGGVALRVAVVDTGIGIPADRVASLFESFSQVDASTTRLYGGTGLGLAISQRLVRAMGGLLTVESAVGIGSTFTFSVTLGAPTPEEARLAHLADLAPAVLHGRSVLIVDDNATNRLTLRLQLERWGMTVTEAGSGHDAIASMHSRRRFDVAMLDMQMPKMDGHELAIALRATPAGRAVPLILLSSPQGRLALPHPDLFAATLTKPVRGGRLEESLVQALTPQAGTSPPVSAPAVPRLTGRRPLRVLLVEDNAVNQRLGRLMVEKLGDHVDVVGDGREATEAVFLVPYDVVLMDVEMPVMDGLEATRIIRRDLSADRPLQIIAMTASALVEDRRACYDAGTDDYLAKPVRLADLDAALVNAAARLQRPPASLATKPPPSTAG